ncbi:Flp pilus assembly protein TadB [Mycobacteroides abscessus subsp. abscessus]|nr:Flp pilus assembly protein TadB [Mycobacteroides abscessus subsp. abscessus]
MMSMMGLLAGLMFGLAVLLVVLGMVPTTIRPHRQTSTAAQRWARLTGRPAGPAGRRRDLIWAAAVVTGIVLAGITGWVALAVLVPALVIVAPKLLGQAPVTDIPLLLALEQWITKIAAVLPEGRSVVQAIRSSQKYAPPFVAEPVQRLIHRMTSHMDPVDALQRFADELDSSEADAVVASLRLAVTRPQGAAANLNAIAANLQDRMRVLRDIEAERARPRRTSRNVTLISLVMMGLLAIASPAFLAPLAQPLGQLIVLAASLIYVGALMAMYRITLPRARARILVQTGGR